MWHGWIVAVEGDKEALESLGVVVGRWDAKSKCFEDCTVSEEALTRLDPLWGAYAWGLELVDEAKEERHGT